MITRAQAFHFDVKVLRMLLTKCGDFSGKKNQSTALALMD